MIRKVSLALFVLASAGELLSTLAVFPFLHKVCKPALLLTLIAWYIFSMRERNGSVPVVVLLALAFSWGGDVLLMGSGEFFFMLGLASFLIAHVFYILSFRRLCNEDNEDSLQGLHMARFAFPVVLYGTGLVVILYDHLGELKIPVMAYALVLTIMVLNALFRFRRTTSSSFILVFSGAILFMISDSLLAVNKFLQPVAWSGFWIMTTYIAAQFLIVLGIMKHDEEVNP